MHVNTYTQVHICARAHTHTHGRTSLGQSSEDSQPGRQREAGRVEGCDHWRGHGPLWGIDAVPGPQLQSLGGTGHRVKENLQSGEGQATVPTSVHGSAHNAVCWVE